MDSKCCQRWTSPEQDQDMCQVERSLGTSTTSLITCFWEYSGRFPFAVMKFVEHFELNERQPKRGVNRSKRLVGGSISQSAWILFHTDSLDVPQRFCSMYAWRHHTAAADFSSEHPWWESPVPSHPCFHVVYAKFWADHLNVEQKPRRRFSGEMVVIISLSNTQTNNHDAFQVS